MLDKAQIQLIQSLKQKKFRQVHRLFVVEGKKNVIEVLGSKLRVKQVIVLHSEADSIQILCPKELEIIRTDQRTIERLSSLTTPQPVIAIVEIPEHEAPIADIGCNLLLDGIRDPGNLGTIIRIADWFGITQIVCSEDTCDAFNPKTVQASMGSSFRVNMLYTSLIDYLSIKPMPIYGAVLDGASIHQIKFKTDHYLIIGNESTGISDDLKSKITNPITIPKIGEAESLNAAVAAAIILDNILRK